MTLLELRNLDARYGELEVLHGVSLSVDEGELICLRGDGGAGKTTALRAVCGTVRTHGEVLLDGERVFPRTPERVARAGIVHIPADRGTFEPLTVLDNLRLGAWTRRGPSTRDLANVFELFPELYDARERRAATLSPAERELLAVGRAFMAHPRVILADEPSRGSLARLHGLTARHVGVLATLGPGEPVPAGASRVYVLDEGQARLVA